MVYSFKLWCKIGDMRGILKKVCHWFTHIFGVVGGVDNFAVRSEKKNVADGAAWT
jgi:hypothetical protein